MADADKRKILVGAILLLAGAAIIIGVSTAAVPNAPYLVGTVATFAVAAGTLLLGTSEPGRPV